ncbi:MAG: sigma 54-interacting transcriptional regulator [Phycisphaerales bacterium]|nr:sigma 54-interacting transcriptional regulator [Phycisphaerales bacterium]
MQRFMGLLLEVWREACQHFDIAEFTARIMPLLTARIPIELLLVRRVDLRRTALETVAAGCRDGTLVAEARSSCSTEQLEKLLAWCRRGEVRLFRNDDPFGKKIPFLPKGVNAEALIGPLCSDYGTMGFLALVTSPGENFSDVHEKLVVELLHPFRAALANDRRLREMASQQEAAEADREALLARLGRREISETIVGAESGLKQVMDRVKLVAHADVPVLLFGETGSGKEVIARAIHTRSDRESGPFLRVNCGAIPPELIDSELFGHERGSFTGAVGTRKGWFERADGGTLFLDEVGELPLAAQVRLLRILQDGSFERVGGQRQLTVDVRVVAATNRDLRQMVSEGRFRDDLWYRLAVFPIELPALRERPEDMPELAAHFALRASRRFGLPLLVPTPTDVLLLLAYDWPGNIRELASVINRAALLGNGKCLETAKALGASPPELHAPSREARAASAVDESKPLKTLDDVVRDHIKEALRKTRGQVEGPTGAAHLLGINPHTLRGRMRKLKIDWQSYRGDHREV